MFEHPSFHPERIRTVRESLKIMYKRLHKPAPPDSVLEDEAKVMSKDLQAVPTSQIPDALYGTYLESEHNGVPHSREIWKWWKKHSSELKSTALANVKPCSFCSQYSQEGGLIPTMSVIEWKETGYSYTRNYRCSCAAGDRYSMGNPAPLVFNDDLRNHGILPEHEFSRWVSQQRKKGELVEELPKSDGIDDLPENL